MKCPFCGNGNVHFCGNNDVYKYNDGVVIHTLKEEVEGTLKEYTNPVEIDNDYVCLTCKKYFSEM